MTLTLQMLGTGGAFAKNYFNNNALFSDGNSTLLIDCGVTASLSLHRLGRDYRSIDGVLITHTHADHCGGLEEVAFESGLRYKKKQPLYIAESLVTPLWENTLKGGLYQENYVESLDDVFNVVPVTPGKPVTVSPGIKIELIQTQHVPGKDTFSVYMNDRIFYSADMKFNPDLLKELVRDRGCEVIFHECQLEDVGVVHTTLEELLSLPEDIQKRIRLMHYGDMMENYRGKTGPMEFLEQHKIYEI